MKAILVCLLALFAQNAASLPEKEKFLAEFRRNLRSDEELLRQYTYTETETRRGSQKSETRVYEVLPPSEDQPGNRRLIAKNGVKVSPQDEKVKRWDAKKDEEVRDEVFQMYDVSLLGRETIDGYPTIVLSFKARPGYKPKSKEADFMKHVAGRAWVEENEHQLVRLDAEVIDPISYGFGLLGKVQKGSHFTASRRKINGEIWLPSRFEIEASARVLFKGVRVDEVHEFSDYLKFGATTTLKFGDAEK
jgi:hypothetical protein